MCDYGLNNSIVFLSRFGDEINTTRVLSAWTEKHSAALWPYSGSQVERVPDIWIPWTITHNNPEQTDLQQICNCVFLI